MGGKGVCCPSRTVLVKGPVSLPTVAAFVALLSGLFHSRPTMADGCPAPSFAAARVFPAGFHPGSLAVGDFNGDGRLDSAVVNVDSRCISVLMGKGDGSFQTAVNYSAERILFSWPSAISTAMRNPTWP